MHALKLAAVIVALLGASAGIFAQSAPTTKSADPPPAAQPLDTRVGAFRPAAGTDSSGQPPVAGQQGAVPLPNVAKDYRVGPNDLIEVEVQNLEKDQAKRTVRVNAAGAISLPLIGSVSVAGLTAQQTEERIAARYSEKYLQNAQVSVFIKEFTTERITVDGAVAKPGIYPLTGQITLLRALALAGGFGPIADSNEVMLFRVNEKGERQVAVFDVDKIRAGKNEDPAIKGDDLIVVQRDATRKLFKDSIFRDVLDSVNPFAIFGR